MPNPPKPTRLKILQGNPGKRRLNRSEPMPKRGRPRCPAWLDDEAKAKWRAVVPELDRLGLMTIIDGDSLAGYCQAWAELKWATETLRKEGRVLTTTSGYSQPHPAVAQQRSALKLMAAFGAMFGLSPSSRGRLNGSPAPDPADPMEQFLNGGA